MSMKLRNTKQEIEGVLSDEKLKTEFDMSSPWDPPGCSESKER